MEFVFEERKNSGRQYMDQVTPKYPAVRITVFKDKNNRRQTARLYVAFNSAAVLNARWIKGDRLVAGADLQRGVICFKRDQEFGFSISGGSLGEDKSKRNMITNMQVSVADDSPLFDLMKDHLGKWFALTAQGLLMVAIVRPSKVQEETATSDLEE